MASGTVKRVNISEKLPSPTGVALRVLELTDREDVTAAQIEEVVRADPSMTARLIRMANAPANGISRNIATVREAVTLLGMLSVKRLVLSFSIISNHQQGSCEGFDYDMFWSDSLARAVAARRLALDRKGVSADEAFICGLFCQIGRLGFASVFADQYADICNATDLIEKEEALFGQNHNQMAAGMMKSWGLPETHCDAVLHQDDLKENAVATNAAAQLLAQTLRLAGLIAQVLVDVDTPKWRLAALVRELTARGHKPAEHEAYLTAISEEWRAAGQVLSITTRVVPSFSEIQQHAEEKRRQLDSAES